MGMHQRRVLIVFVEEEEEFRKPVRSRKKSGSLGDGKVEGKTSQKRTRVSYDDEDEEYINDDEGETDEEFTPDEDDDDCLDEDEELTVKRKSRNVKVIKRRVPKRGSGRCRKRIRKSRVLEKPLARKGRNKRKLKKKERCEYDDEDDGDFLADSSIVGEKSKKHSGVRKRNFAVNSDSDFLSNGSSDYDYTISEEEREQVREANQLFGDLKTSLRSSSAGKRFQENGDLCEQTKPLGRKGKEKVEEVKSELGRQVCGICLSEEDKRRFRGTLDCCSHYFCFTCIMEWSKVESRCPLCKQRFRTITKNGRSIVGVDLRNMVIQVPKRDQVYQPTEEEIRSYIDPYENVICKECHEGGDDGLMLLCDLCDSSAHTYCVGLGRQVPEGNWYCDDCRPVALGSSSSQTQDSLPDQWNISSNIFNRPSLMLNLEEGKQLFQNLRTQEVDTLEQTHHEERLQTNDHQPSSFQNRDSFYLTPNQLTRQTVQDPTIPTADRPVNLTLWPELMGINSMPGYEQLHEFGSRAMTGHGGTLSSYPVREESPFYDVNEKLQSMVKNHLASLSHDTELDHDTFKDISRSSTHTILAACGLEHKRSEVHTVPPPSTCIHMDRVVAGQTSPMKGHSKRSLLEKAEAFVKKIAESEMKLDADSFDRLATGYHVGDQMVNSRYSKEGNFNQYTRMGAED
ncbi:hypothetical protein NC652_012513 [Populus alba x Populus x berolinensis]|nr:hypothetical protein NC652_012513 [Populus alba x Populus x berolinensis]